MPHENTVKTFGFHKQQRKYLLAKRLLASSQSQPVSGVIWFGCESMNWINLAQIGTPVVVFCEHDNETLCSIKGKNFLGHLRDYQLVKKYPVLFSYFIGLSVTL